MAPASGFTFLSIILLWLTCLETGSTQPSIPVRSSQQDSILPSCFLSPVLTKFIDAKDDNEPIKVILASGDFQSLTKEALQEGIILDFNKGWFRQGYFSCTLLKREIAIISHLKEIEGIELNRLAIPELKQEDLDLSLNEINIVHDRYPGLQGNSFLLSIKESGFDTNDIDFKNRYVQTIPPVTTNIHSTNMASISGGGGNSDPTAIGVAQDVSLTSSDFGFLFPDPDSIFIEHNITVQNHSYGTAIENYYGLESVDYDQFCNHFPYVLHVFSVGNQYSSAPNTGTYANLEGWANLSGQFKQSKNTISVSSLDSLDQWEIFSSRGPAYDGRIKPELALYGPGGTSNAAALLSGSSILLQEAYAKQHGGNLPLSSSIKAVLINTAKDLDVPGPDFKKGFGSARIMEALKSIGENHLIENSLMQQETKEFIIQVPANTAHLSLTIVWNDPAASLNATKALVNDLDLRLVENTTQISFYPWLLNTQPDQELLSLPATHGIDTLNNVERIDVESPNAATYTVLVSGKKIKTAFQEFSLTWHFIPANHFIWTFPTSADVLRPGSPSLLRWKSNILTPGKLEFKSAKEEDWQLIINEATPSNENLSWMAPNENGLYQLKWSSGDSIYLTDTFAVSNQVSPKVGLICGDSLLVYWNRVLNADQYEIETLGDRHLEPSGITNDTFFVFHLLDDDPIHFAVTPLFGQHHGFRSPTFNHQFQHAGCYINTFYLKEIINNEPVFEIDLGVLINIKSLHLQVFTGNSFIAVDSLEPVTQLANVMEGTLLHQGINDYRVVIELMNGNTITSDTERVYFLEDTPVLVFPNPANGGDEIHFLSKSAASYNLQLLDMQGREIIQIDYPENPLILKLPNLPSGMYIAVFHFETGETEKQLFMLK